MGRTKGSLNKAKVVTQVELSVLNELFSGDFKIPVSSEFLAYVEMTKKFSGKFPNSQVTEEVEDEDNDETEPVAPRKEDEKEEEVKVSLKRYTFDEDKPRTDSRTDFDPRTVIGHLNAVNK